MLQNGIIKPSVSPWASPVVLVTKAEKTLRLCIDYWSLNKATIKDSYPLPQIQDTLDTLYGNNLFTTLDLLKGFRQIEVEESSRKKTAFTTHTGLFQYIRLPFGLTNHSASFQWLLEHVLWNYMSTFVILYIDDILIYSTAFNDHHSQVAQALQTLKVALLKIRIDKCQFAKNSVKFLGHPIIPERTGPNKKNIKAVTSFPILSKVKDVRTFLDLCNYYWRFLKNYLVLTGPLLQLLKKNATFHWHSSQYEIIYGTERETNHSTHFVLPRFFYPVYII